MTPTLAATLGSTLKDRSGRVSTARWVSIAALALIAIQLILRAHWVSRSWFYSDDFLFLGDIGHGDDSIAWYFRFHFSHFMPLSFLLVKLATLFGAFSWSAAAAEILVMQLGASIAAWWMLRTVFGSRPGILVPLTFFLFSAMTISSVMWWAVAINQLPHQIAVFGAIGAHTLYLRHHRARHIWLTAAFLLLGYLTYTKTMLLPIVLILFTLTYFAEGNLGKRLLRTARRDWRAWAVHGTMLVSYVVAYVVRQPPGAPVDFSGNPLALGFDSLSLGLVPTLAGGPLHWIEWTNPVGVVHPGDPQIVASWVLLAAVVAYLSLTRTRVLRALIIPATYFVMTIALIYIGRFYIINFVGSFYISRHLQYLADTAAILTLTIGLMCFHVPGSVESSQRRTRPLFTYRVPTPILVASGALILVGYIVSSARFAEPWNVDFPQRHFFQSATRALAEERPDLADTAIPAIGISPFLFPHNLPELAFSPVAKDFAARRVGNDLKIFREDATLAPAVLDGPVRTTADPTRPCPYQVEDRPRRIRFAPVVNFPLWMAIEYTATRDGSIPLEFGSNRKTVPIKTGSHTLFVSSSADYDSIMLRPLVGQRICVKSVSVGGLRPEGRP